MFVLRLMVEKEPIVRVVAAQTNDTRWRIERVRANLPSLLRGHNGRLISSKDEYYLALTRLQHVLKMLVSKEGHDRLLPGLDPENSGHLLNTEVALQVADPGQRLVWASHSSHRKGQRGPNRIYPGESTRTPGRIGLSIYDKVRQMAKKDRMISTSGLEATRAEVIALKGSDLAMEMARMKALDPKSHQHIATISFEDAFKFFTRNIGLMDGFRWQPSAPSRELSRTSQTIITTLGPHILDANRVEGALHAYAEGQTPCVKTRRRTERQVRGWAAKCHLPSLADVLQDCWDNVRLLDVPWPRQEENFARLAGELNFPNEVDPRIQTAWSITRFVTVG